MASTRQEIIEELKALLEQDVMAVKDQVDHLKTQFYTTSEETAEPAEGESAEEVAANDPIEEQFKELLAQYKAKRAEITAAQAKEQADNLARKQAILDEMRQLAEGADADGVMANLQRMRELQATWKTIGAVPAPQTQEIRKAYQQYQEQFYDLVKINIELRDLDFKKNLELKTLLCEAAERLQNNDNIVEASRALQQLHDEWAEIGPVARDLREDLWNRFKTASTIINKKHQAYFDELHAKEQANLDAKRAIIEQLKALNEPIVNGEPWNAKKWDEATQKVQELQSNWRKIGFAPKKYNQSIYDEYRAECDRFFHAKTEYFKEIRDVFANNLKHKRSLLEQAKALVENQKAKVESGEMTRELWDETTAQMQALQAEWKTVGVVARKYSEDLWKQFSETCDLFFNAKREAAKGERVKARDERVAKAAKAAANQGVEGLRRMRDRLQQEIKTAENNILFFTGKSKNANKLVEDMQRKIDGLKKQLEDINDKINQED
ncbi:MAG: DUF349 domain-containing protein [Paludibacteraceae bacterium]|nr:DUF349 domain-containing protein [Paludibacteraceae bacterium]